MSSPPTPTSPASSRKPAPSRRRPEFAAPGARQEPAEYERALASGPRTTRRASGPSRPKSLRLVQAAGTRSSTGTSRTRNGSSAASSTSAHNCLDRHLRRAAPQQGRHHLGRRTRRQPRADLPGAAPRGLQVRQRPQGARRPGRATASRSTCRWSRKRRSPCWPAPASGRRTASSSAASAPTPSPTATTTPRRSSSSPPTAAGGAARSCRSRQNVDAALEKSPTVEKCIVFNRCNQQVDDEGRPRPLVARADGRRLRRLPAGRRSTANTRSTSSTPPARPANPRACCTPSAGYLLGASLTHKWVFDIKRRRRLLVYRRRRLGDGPQLHRLRPAVPTAPRW